MAIYSQQPCLSPQENGAFSDILNKDNLKEDDLKEAVFYGDNPGGAGWTGIGHGALGREPGKVSMAKAGQKVSSPHSRLKNKLKDGFRLLASAIPTGSPS